MDKVQYFSVTINHVVFLSNIQFWPFNSCGMRHFGRFAVHPVFHNLRNSYGCAIIASLKVCFKISLQNRCYITKMVAVLAVFWKMVDPFNPVFHVYYFSSFGDCWQVQLFAVDGFVLLEETLRPTAAIIMAINALIHAFIKFRRNNPSQKSAIKDANIHKKIVCILSFFLF